MILSYNIIGEKINTYKTSAKIQKLKQNLSKEVVWVMKDDSFINFRYFLSIENNFNNYLTLANNNTNLNKSMLIKKSNNTININTSLIGNNKNNNNINNNIPNNNKINQNLKNYNSNNIKNNNNINNNANINLDASKVRTAKKIIKRKSDNLNAVNGGIFNTDNEGKISNLKPSLTMKSNYILNNDINNSIINNVKEGNNYTFINTFHNNNSNKNNNNNPNNANYIKKKSFIKMNKKELNNHNDIPIPNDKKNLIPTNYLTKRNVNNQNNKTKININGSINKLNNNKNETLKSNNIKEAKINNKNINNLNINEVIYNSASPKKNHITQNAPPNKIDFTRFSLTNSMGQDLGASILNTSDCMSISNKNDKLNLTVNTIDNNTPESKYKILSNNNHIKDADNIYSKEYISCLNFKDYEYDTFCQAIIKTGLSENKMSLSKYSENFPAPCGHELCSKLPALEPNVLTFYQNLNKNNIIDLKQAATSHLIFPLGIKLCVDQNYLNEELTNEPLINTIYNIKGDIYYIASLTYYRKISIKNYNRIFNINPINVYNTFKQEEKEKEKNMNNNLNNDNSTNNNNQKDNINNNPVLNNNIQTLNQKVNISIKNNNMSNNNLANENNNNSEKKEDEILNFSQNDTIYIPECLSLVSRFPYFNQLSKCLKIIINMRRQIVNGDNNQQIINNISLFINHLINQVPIGNNKSNILFYTPLSIEPLTLYNPFCYNFGNFACDNIFSLLNIDNIITIFLLVLLEQKIIFVDKSHLLLSAISFFFINLIYPLSWVNTYQPLLSLSTIRYIQSITPFIMGSNENLILYAYFKKYIIYNENIDNIDKSNIVFVSLSNNLVSCDCYNLINNKKGQSRKHILKYLGIPELPKSIEKKLYNHLSEIEKMDNPKIMNEKIKTFFCRIMVFILDDYKEHYLYSLDKPIFNKENYLMCKKEDKKPFYKELLATQLFTQFIFCENELYKSKKFGKKLKMKNSTYGILHDGVYKDYTFFMKNKNKIEDLKIMIKKRRKEKIRKSILSAKKLVKNIGQMFYGTNDNKKMEFKEKSVKKSIKTNISIIKHKKEGNKIINVLLMPYFIEEPNIELNDLEKYDYIQNKLNSILTLDNQLNQINNYKNKYIFEFNQRFDLKSIKDDNTRYFIGILKEEQNDNDLNLLNISSFDNCSKLNGINSVRNSKKGSNMNIIKKQVNEEENKYVKTKEKINLWFTNIYLNSTKKKLTNNIIDINEELRNERYRKYFTKLISQNYRTLFDIRENNQNFLNNESFMELLLKIKIILNYMTYEEFETCKLITLSCFKYFTILEEHKHTRFYLYNKYNDLYPPCNLWLNNIFWKTWFDEDISFVEKKLNKSDENDYNLDLNKSNDEDNELFEYNEENDNCSIEYKLLIKINNVMISLKLGEEFIKKVVFEDLASNYLTEEEINLFREQYE